MAQDYLNTVAEIRQPSLWRVASVLVLLVAIGLSWGAMGYSQRSLEDVWQDRVEALALIHQTTAPIYRVLPALSEVGHPVAMDSASLGLNTAQTESKTAWKAYLGTTLTEAEVALMNQTTGPVAELHQGVDSLISTLKAGDHTQYVRQMNNLFYPRLGAVGARMDALVALQQAVTRQRVAEARRRYQVSRWLLIGSGVAVVGMGLAGIRSRGRVRGSP